MIRNLRDSLADSMATMSNVVSLKDFISKNNITFTKAQDAMLKEVYLSLSNRSIAAAEGEGEYGKTKAEILSLLPSGLAVDVDTLFKEFETVVGDSTLQISQQDKRKEALQKIVDLIKKYVAPE
jgi:hypothetical protein